MFNNLILCRYFQRSDDNIFSCDGDGDGVDEDFSVGRLDYDCHSLFLSFHRSHPN